MERISKSNLFRGLVLALVVAISGLALAACGGGHEEKEGLAEGEIVELGPLQYNVLFTRPLNINDIEDSQYLVGQPKPGPNQMYIGVFVHVHNDSDDPHTIPDSFKITTTAGREYENIPARASTRSSRGRRSNRMTTSRGSTRPPRSGRSRLRCCSI